MKEDVLETLRLWGKQAIWSGRRMHVYWATGAEVSLCPFPMCVPVAHDHIRVGRWLFRWDEKAQVLRPFWVRSLLEK